MADLRDFTGKNRVFTGTTGERISNGDTGTRVNTRGVIRFNTTTNLMEYYTGNDWKSIDAPPTITQFTVDGGADVTTANINSSASGNATIEVKGSLFDTTGATVTFVGTAETISTQSITRNSANLLTVTVARSDFDNTNEPYAIKVTNGSGLSAELAGAISQDQPVTFTNAADTNYNLYDTQRGSVSIAAADLCGATDADSDTITYSISSGSLPSGLSIASATGVITGSTSAVGSDTVSTFTVQAATTDSTITRQFTITQKAPNIQSFTSTGAFTYTIPSGATSANVLVVAGGGYGGGGTGGGGGAGGMVEVSGFDLTPYSPGTVPGSVGAAPSAGIEISPGNGTNSVFGSLTAIGGGSGGWDNSPNGRAPQPGGSGGGGNGYNARARGSGTGTQPSQPGASGSSGYGNPGQDASNNGGGGGGGAGGTSSGGNGGAGRASSVSGSSVTYAGGGGGGGPDGSHSGGSGGGGQGSPGPGDVNGRPGTTNRGGGGGGSWDHGQPGGGGGSGIVVVQL